MYLEVKKVSKDEIFANISHYLANECDTAKEYGIPTLDNSMWRHFVDEMFNLNEALCNGGGSVFAVCIRCPRSLNSGYHYFDVYYVINNKIKKFCLLDIMPLVGAMENERIPRLSYYVFKSNAKGDRVLDATKGLFDLLSKIGGCQVTRISCVNYKR